MEKLARLLHGNNTEATVPAVQCTAVHGKFLDLPGEIRNQIYANMVYPDLPLLTIANCAEPEHLAASLLHLPLFRTCAQIRTEALSYLCANIPLRILGLQTANIFFSCAGGAISKVKSLVLVQAGMGISWDRVRKFFKALEIMPRLVELRLEGVEKGGENAEFIRELETLRERGVNVQVRSAQRLGS